MDGIQDVVDIDFDLVANHKDHLATYITNLWNGYHHSPEVIRWKEESDEVKRFRYATDTRETSNSSNPHSHNTHLPKITQIADTLEAHYYDALFPHDEWIQFQPADKNSHNELNRRLIEAYIQSRHRLNGFEREAADLIRDWMDDGNCFAEAIWDSHTAGAENGILRKAYVGPKLRRIAPHRIAFNTQASSFQDSWKIVRSLKTRGDIAKDIMNETLSPEYREILEAVEEFRGYVSSHSGNIGDDWAGTAYASDLGTNLQYFGNSNLVEMLTFYGTIYDTENKNLLLNRKIVIVDRKWVLLNEEINTFDGNPYIYHSTWRKKPNTLLGMGPLHNLTGMQYMLNHLQNSKADGFDDMIKPDKLFSSIDDVKLMPDGSRHYYTHDGGQVMNIAPDTTILSADFQLTQLEQKMEEYAGVPPEASGFKTPGEQTKFEVAERMSASSRLFQNRVSLFERDIAEPIVNAELELAKVYLDQNLEVMTNTSEAGSIFEEITPELLRSNGSLIAKGARHYAQQARLTQELSNFVQVTAADPEIRAHFPPSRIAKAFDSLLGGFNQKEGIYQEFGRMDEQTKAQMRLSAARQMVDEAQIQESNLSVPDGTTEDI